MLLCRVHLHGVLVLGLASACHRGVPQGASVTSDAALEQNESIDASDARASEQDAEVALKLSPPSEPSDPFGIAKTSTRQGCGALGAGVSKPDRDTSFVDGDDWLALVNRAPTGQLPPEYAPKDLVELS